MRGNAIPSLLITLFAFLSTFHKSSFPWKLAPPPRSITLAELSFRGLLALILHALESRASISAIHFRGRQTRRIPVVFVAASKGLNFGSVCWHQFVHRFVHEARRRSFPARVSAVLDPVVVVVVEDPTFQRGGGLFLPQRALLSAPALGYRRFARRRSR